MTSREIVEAGLRLPPLDERRYDRPGLRQAVLRGQLADPAWRPADGRATGRRPLLAGAAVLALVLVTGVAVIGALRTNQPARPSPDPAAAAAALGVNPTELVATVDGMIAARKKDATVELAIARSTADGWVIQVLGSFIEPPEFAGSASLELSCAASFGLRQPNFAYGDIHDDLARPPATIRVDGLAGTGSPYSNGPWVVAFQLDGPIHDRRYSLTADRGQQYQLEPIGGGSFTDPQSCGTVEDLSKPAQQAATPSPPPGTGRLVVDSGSTTYNNEPSATGPVASYPVQVIAPDGTIVFESQVTGEQTVDLAPGTYRVAVKGGLNDCAGTVTLAAGRTTALFIEWFAGGCRVSSDPTTGSASPGPAGSSAVARLTLQPVVIPPSAPSGGPGSPAPDLTHLVVQVSTPAGQTVWQEALDADAEIILAPGAWWIRAWQTTAGGGPEMHPCLTDVTLAAGELATVTIAKWPHGAACNARRIP